MSVSWEEWESACVPREGSIGTCMHPRGRVVFFKGEGGNMLLFQGKDGIGIGTCFQLR